MSRCFPYTRQNYKREDVSLIGSIQKLPIRWGNTKQRSERSEMNKKIKEKQYKKRSREEHVNLDSVERKSKKRRDDNKIKFNKIIHEDYSHNLEKSDLSEEHDPPAFVLNQCNSSENTQNSSKKNGFQDADLNKKRPGMVFRIKLSLKKHKDPEPVSASTDPRCSSPATKSSKVQTFFTESAPAPGRSSSQVTKTSKVQTVFTESAPSRSSSQVTKTSNVQAVLTESAHRSSSPQATKLSKAQAVLAAKQPFSAIEEPCFSGRVAEAPILHKGVVEAIPSDSRHKRHSGGSSTQRSERQQFSDLIINWKPPSLELNEAEEGELDWLLGPRKPQDAKPNAHICKAGISDPTACPSSASSLQPRAIHLPEFDTYQLPYVIPF